jgi:hypothetical protein
MPRRLVAAILLVGVVGAACYQDDILRPAGVAPTRVLLTDDPFPFDTVASVNIYIDRIEASTGLDSTVAGTWVTLAAPSRAFDLLTLQQGVTALVGQGVIDAGRYHVVRMTIDVSKSSIKFRDGSDAVVYWSYAGAGEVTLYAQVEQGVDVPAAGAGTELVIIFDVGRSFFYNLTGQHDFVMFPVLRAVNSAATGAITGQVVAAPPGAGSALSVANANVTVFSGNPAQPPTTWNVIGTTRTAANGAYVAGFLPAGSWNVEYEKPDDPTLKPIIIAGLVVSPGDTTHQSVLLPNAGAAGSYLGVFGPSTVGVGGTVVVHAVVGDSTGTPQPSPQVTWFSRDSAIATVLQDSASASDSMSNAIVLGRAEGSTWIVARSGALEDSLALQVVIATPPTPVASITLVPASLTLALGDTGVFTAELRDSTGALLMNRQISWFLTDSTGVATIYLIAGNTAGVRAQRSGTTHLRAASEGKFKDATITVP